MCIFYVMIKNKQYNAKLISALSKDSESLTKITNKIIIIIIIIYIDNT